MSRRRRRKSNGFKVFMLVVLAICLFVLGKQEYRIYQIKQEQAATEQRIEALKKKKAEQMIPAQSKWNSLWPRI